MLFESETGTTHIKITQVIETVTRSTDIGTTNTFTTLKDCGCCSPENNFICCISRGWCATANGCDR